MKRWVPLLLALAAVAYLGAMAWYGALPQRKQLVKFEATGLLREPPERVDTVVVTIPPATQRTFKRVGQGWEEHGTMLDAGHAGHLDMALRYMHNSGPVRAMSLAELQGQDPREFGMAPPRFTVRVQREGVSLLDAGFGGTNHDGVLNYVGVIGRSDLFMLSHFVIAEWDKVIAP